ncbi:MAG TPA: beta-galactosidase [Opitutaceae bacterium]|nr:beta-galactosidase [Opitutaceae bacterium]
MKLSRFLGAAIAALTIKSASAEALTATLVTPAPAESGYFKMGTTKHPDGRELTVDSQSLRLDGRAWTPVMGEFHYSRYPAAEWREELLKMKAGGVDIVATYVFWIHHEEIDGQWDWSGQRNLRQFIEAAREVGLTVVVRCGPWCHGEVRNGGLPEWVQLSTEMRRRSTDPRFMARVRVLYEQIALQLKGLMWKDGGPVVGIQVDNEFRGPAEYLLALKKLAQEVGLDTPFYTRTGWPDLTTPMPVGEILPLYGVYAEGFWDRAVTPMPSRYWAGFHFSALRTDVAIATEMLGNREAKDVEDVLKYPFFTCEIGGGMMSSYHRRILVDSRDIESTTLIKVAGGSTLPGYYMYHGGTNPEGKRTTLMEAQNTAGTNYNDLPTKSYDFQAPLGEFGQIRLHYHTQRRLHLFLRDFGDRLAGMSTVLPEVRPAGKDDSTTLRWAARSNGTSGFVFVNNYERLKTLPGKTGVQFSLKRADGSTRTFPSEPVTVPSGAIFFWPFDFDLGHGAKLDWATAQPICAIDDGDVRTVFFAETPGVPAQVSLDGVVQTVKAGRGVAAKMTAKGGAVQLVVLDQADSLALWKEKWHGRDYAFLTKAGLVVDGNVLRITSNDPMALTVSVLPKTEGMSSGTVGLSRQADGVFVRYTPRSLRLPLAKVAWEKISEPGPAREIRNGPIKQAVPQAPDEADFAQGAVWKIKLPAGVDLALNPILRIRYTGDVARLTLDGKLLTDDFYNGNVFELGLRRFAPEILQGDLRLVVLPLRKDAPIYLATSAQPDFGDKPSVAAVESVELISSVTVELTALP